MRRIGVVRLAVLAGALGVALGGIPETADAARSLVDSGAARVLVISDPYPAGYPTIRRLCPAAPSTEVICFRPAPSTTRGEAQEIGRLADSYGWDDVVVLAPTFHISRARVVVRRCFSGRLRMVDPHVHFARHLWPYHFVYQSAGFVKVAAQRGC